MCIFFDNFYHQNFQQWNALQNQQSQNLKQLHYLQPQDIFQLIFDINNYNFIIGSDTDTSKNHDRSRNGNIYYIHNIFDYIFIIISFDSVSLQWDRISNSSQILGVSMPPEFSFYANKRDDNALAFMTFHK